jgi:hypothetical protein
MKHRTCIHHPHLTSRVLLAAIAAIAPSLLAVATSADAAVPEDVVVAKVDTSRHPEVSLVVAPPRLLSETDLTADAFTVTESGQTRPVTVNRLPDASLQIVLVLDPAVSSTVFRSEQGAALDFLLRLPPGTRVALLNAGASPQVAFPMAPDPQAAGTAMGTLDPGSGRAIYDALLRANDEFRAEDGARRAVVVFSGSKDTSSRTTLEEVATQFEATGTNLFAVELGTTESDNALASIAAEAGGQTMRVGATELVGAYQRVADVLLNQYEVTFQSQSRGNARLQVDVAANGFSGSSSVSLPLPALEEEPAAGAVSSERSGGRAVVDPLAAALTIFIVLLIGALLISLGHAGLRSHSTPTG